ncbi:MAG TPA: alpha/beta fold hydrolase, partial [Gaiellaceae bacterium]|nr:alpha/beta fold hydrolase [Gaiellaceae bacterium]
EARLNSLPQFVTKIDGVDIHFIHVKSRHETALPLIMTHGWPGSVIELLETVGPLTDPTAHGGRAEDAFHLVLPSLPGYGFSGEPADLGWDASRTARAWAELMDRLGYSRYVAQGGDVGATVTDAMGRQGPEGVLGIHVKSQHENAIPLIMTHGWPGSVIELLETIGPLTDPTAHGGTPEDAFHLVLPSLPGYGFSGEPTELGWENGPIARAWAELMDRLGYTRYVAQGGDVGAAVTDAMGRQAPEGLLGIHVNLLALAIGLKDQLPAESEQERAAHKALETFTTDGFGYFLEQSTRPQTIGYSLLDSPIGLAAWMLDHDTDSYYKISRAFVDGEPVGNLTRDNIVDNITLYWLTGTGASAARWYWEFGRFLAAAGASGQAPPAVSVPVGFTAFPGEIWAAPRSWVETAYPGLAYFNEVDRGGHFAAWEEPELFSAEVRAVFRSLR